MESGHSYVECDSINGTIQRCAKHQKVYNPREWEILIQPARKKPRP